MTTHALGYGEAGVISQTMRLNDASSGNDILKGQAVALLTSGVGTAPNTGAKIPLCTRAGSADLKTIGVAMEKISKGGSATAGLGEFGRVALYGFVQVRLGATTTAGQKIGPAADGDWDPGVGSAGELAVALEGGGNGDLVLAYILDRGQEGFGGS